MRELKIEEVESVSGRCPNCTAPCPGCSPTNANDYWFLTVMLGIPGPVAEWQ